MAGREIAVAGCGPAGLSAALLLHRDGHRVTLFERFEAPRPLGSGLLLQPTGQAVLADLGLGEVVEAVGSRVTRLVGEARPSGRTVLDVRYAALGPNRFAIGLHRAALFAALNEAVLAAGLPIETARTVTASELASDGRRSLVFADGRSAGPFDLVVDALGTSTPLAAQTGRLLAYGALWATVPWPQQAGLNEEAGLDPGTLAQRYVRSSTMAGLLPIGRVPGRERPHAAFFWSIRLDQVEEWRRAGLEAWRNEVLSLWPALAPVLAAIRTAGDLTLARYAHRTVPRPAEAGLIHIGDAWHSASPQLGQGANMALLDAYALAKGLRDAPASVADGIARAVALRRSHVALYQAITALFTPVYQSDNRVLPLMRDRLVGPLSRLWPLTTVQAALVAGLVGGPLGRLGLASPRPHASMSQAPDSTPA